MQPRPIVRSSSSQVTTLHRRSKFRLSMSVHPHARNTGFSGGTGLASNYTKWLLYQMV